MHTIQERPVVRNGQIVIRPMMYLAVSYDHRVVDGKEAVTFLVRIKEALEDPRRILMDSSTDEPLTPELTVLALTALLQFGQIVLAARLMNRDVGVEYNAGPRDASAERSATGRLRRAVANHFEALALFTIAVVVVTLSGSASTAHRDLRLGLPRRAHPLRARLRLRLVALAIGDLRRRSHRHPGDDPRGPVLTGACPVQGVRNG